MLDDGDCRVRRPAAGGCDVLEGRALGPMLLVSVSEAARARAAGDGRVHGLVRVLGAWLQGWCARSRGFRREFVRKSAQRTGVEVSHAVDVLTVAAAKAIQAAPLELGRSERWEVAILRRQGSAAWQGRDCMRCGDGLLLFIVVAVGVRQAALTLTLTLKLVKLLEAIFEAGAGIDKVSQGRGAVANQAVLIACVQLVTR